ncbi:MAG: hypothetical protein PHH58_05590, partial [Rhodoferax sp.]|nr:hypothetical protein [Rhodoferax sp.]
MKLQQFGVMAAVFAQVLAQLGSDPNSGSSFQFNRENPLGHYRDFLKSQQVFCIFLINGIHCIGVSESCDKTRK